MLHTQADGILHQRVYVSPSLSSGCPMGKCHSPFHGTLASYLIQSTSLKKLPIKYDGFESISVSMPRQWEPNEQCFHNQFNSMPNFSMRCVLTLQQCLHHYIKSESVDFKSDEVLFVSQKFFKYMLL